MALASVMVNDGESSEKRLFRCSLRGAAEAWKVADELARVGSNLRQRFRPAPPERRQCRRFLEPGGCPFGDGCTHSHKEFTSGATVEPTAPRVCIHKLADRKVGRGAESLMIRTLQTGGFSTEPVPPEDADLLLANAFPPPRMFAKLKPGCFVNHFPGEEELGAKDRLARLVRGTGICPMSFVMPEEEERLRQFAVNEVGDDVLWILKPCRQGEGRHIEVLSGNVQEVVNATLCRNGCVVSEYIQDPLLIKGRKADQRVYVLVTAVQPCLEAFVFRDGLVRICSKPYDVSQDGLLNTASHISNNAVQTKSSRHACALNWNLRQLEDWLRETGGPDPDAIWDRIIRLVRDTLEAWLPAAHAAASRTWVVEGPPVKSFSLLAFDLLIDRSGRPWLLEVNPKPALHAQSASLKAVFPVHFALKSALLADAFSLLNLPDRSGEAPPSQPNFGEQGDTFGFVRV